MGFRNKVGQLKTLYFADIVWIYVSSSLAESK